MALNWRTRTSAARDDRDAPADELLLQASRNGDLEAFATLFRRYHQAVVQVAAATSRSFDPEDLAAEAFTRIWAAIQDGRGPTQSFLPYARTVVRNVAASWSRRSWESPTEPEQLERASCQSAETDTFEDALAEHQLVSEAFSTLPGRWQSVLWMTEVEGKRAAEVAAELQISPNAAAALSKRARSALGGAWLQAQVDTRGRSGECQWVLEHIGRHVRNSLTDQQRARVRDHLDACQECDRASRRIAHLGSSLRLVALLAGGTAAGLAAWTTSAATPAFAASALPTPAPGGAPGAGGATRNVVKQLARQALASQGAIAVGVAAAAVAIAAVVVPGALHGKESMETAGAAVGTVNRAPQPVVPPRAPTVPDVREPEIEVEPSIEETEPVDTAPVDEEATLLVGRSTTDRKPAPKNGNTKPTDPGERPEPTDPRPEPTDPQPEPTDPQPEPTDPQPEPTDPQPEPTDPWPGPTDPQPEPDPKPEPTDPWCPSWPDWPGWHGWQVNPDWQINPGWPGWPIDPECPTQPTPTEPTDPIEPGEPDEPSEPANPGEPGEPDESIESIEHTDTTDPGGPGQPTESVDPPAELEEPQPQPVESPGPGDAEPPAERANAHTDDAAGIADVTAEDSAASSAHEPDSPRQRHPGLGTPSGGDPDAESSAEATRDAD